jgi:hypothetical protein
VLLKIIFPFSIHILSALEDSFTLLYMWFILVEDSLLFMLITELLKLIFLLLELYLLK